MPTNIEIKALLTDRAAAEAVAALLSDEGPEIIHQEDFFFPCEGARLKLRIFSADRGELIRYERIDRAEARSSSYIIASTSDPQALLKILCATLGLTGTVRKKRTLYLIGQTRVHLDQVEGLGDFLELEVVLRPGQAESHGREIANHLMQKFRISPNQLIGAAYVELLAQPAVRVS
jgi:predicted adenylyl cyclase CyaB